METTRPMVLATEMARLAASTLRRHPEFVGEAAFLPVAAPFFASLIERASAQGMLECLRLDGRLVGFVMAWHEADSPLGVPVTHGCLHLDLDAPSAVSWAEERLAALYESTPDDLKLELDTAYRALLPRMVALGYGVESVALGQSVASVRQAIDDFGGRGLPDRFALRPLASRADIDAVIGLQKDAYTHTPEFCPWGATDGNLDTVRQGLAEGLERQWPSLVLVEDGAIVGYLGATLLDANPYWGRTAVADVVFAEHIRGRGLLRPCGLALIDRLLTADVRTLLGPTAQRPVMRLAAQLGAHALAWMMTKSSPFPPDHFDPFAPL
ncbi:MAG: GNAT family N-acetyltransferase [Candidatus Sericytochromatia bacterium]